MPGSVRSYATVAQTIVDIDPSQPLRSICRRGPAPPGASIAAAGNWPCVGFPGQARADQDRMAGWLHVVPHGTADENVEANHENVLRTATAARGRVNLSGEQAA